MATLRPLLLHQLLLLAGFLALGVAAGPHPNRRRPPRVGAGMLGVAATEPTAAPRRGKSPTQAQPYVC